MATIQGKGSSRSSASASAAAALGGLLLLGGGPAACGSDGPEDESASGVASAGEVPVLDEAPVCVGPAAVTEGIAEATLTPVILVPEDRALDDDAAERIDQALQSVAGWYRRELGDAELRLGPTVTVHSDAPLAAYTADGAAWERLPDELAGALGSSPWSPGRGVLVLGVGFGKLACGDGNGEAGLAVLGLDGLIDRDACAGAYWCSDLYWIGDAIRNTGRILTLGEGSGDSIMTPWSSGHYGERTLSAGEKATVRAQPFIALAGDAAGKADWEPCAGDLECASLRCGCNGWYQPVCLPSPEFAKSCVPEPFCGDGQCLGSESCSSCPDDCGACPPACGDGVCNGDETCQICPVDCGACPPTCGDTLCNGDETCSTCPGDCGPCPCPCSGDPNVDNFCQYAPNTPGCAMTQAGGYCDPNGNGGYEDADWEQGYYHYFDQCK